MELAGRKDDASGNVAYARTMSRTLAVGAWSLAGILIAVVCVRRLTGHFAPVGFVPLTALAFAGAVMVWASRVAFGPNRWFPWPHVVPSVLLLALAWAVSVPGSSTLGLVVLWSLLLCAEGLYWLWCHGRTQPRSGDSASTKRTRDIAANALTDFSVDADVEALAILDDTRITQHIVRSSEHGFDTLSGEFRCHFAARERIQALHVVFCPPFHAQPEVFVEQLEGAEVEIKTTQLQPYGARFDMKLASVPSQEVVVALRVVARAAFCFCLLVTAASGLGLPCASHVI